MLAKCLNLRPEVAGALFKDMVVDGVLRAPGTSGMARAAQPFDTTGLKGRIKTKAKDVLKQALKGEERSDEPAPLVNDGETPLVSPANNHEDTDHARPYEPPEESAQRG